MAQTGKQGRLFEIKL